jgi:hypothetical protein
MKGNTKKLAVFVVIAAMAMFIAAAKASAFDPKKCPPKFVTVVEKEGKKEYVFGATAIAYSPAAYNEMLEAYGVKISK